MGETTVVQFMLKSCPPTNVGWDLLEEGRS